MQTLYFDCFAGISGDMTIGALLDLGLDFKALEMELKKLSLDGYKLSLSRVLRSQISATKFDVVLTDTPSHTHQHAHNHEHVHSHTHQHDQHDHNHAHSHSHDHHTHHDHKHNSDQAYDHAHRGLREINLIIDNSNLSDWVKENSKKIFYRLAVAEGRIHNIPPEQVHFHEVGAIDAIVDIIGACIGFELLGVKNFISSPLHVGRGFVNCTHGRFPIPAPATQELLKNIPTYSTEIEGELVTPTGAAIVSTLCTEFKPLPQMKVEQIGYGAGGRDPKSFPNVLRLFLGTLDTSSTSSFSLPSNSVKEEVRLKDKSNSVTVIEANIDDMNPQIFGYLMDKLLKQGALDVFYTPIYMKKNRPGVLLTILVEERLFESITQTIFQETTTLGVRYYETNRRTLVRHSRKVNTDFGTVDVKFAFLENKIVNVMPEYESCLELAQNKNVALALVQVSALNAFEKEREALQKELYKG